MHDPGWALARWRTVLSRIPDPHPCVTPEFQQAWWAHFGEGEAIVETLGNGSPIAVAALQRTDDGVVRFLGDRAVTDYGGPAVAPADADAAAAELLQRLQGAFVRLELDNARPEDAFAAALVRAAEAGGHRVVVEDDEPVAVLDLPGDWDTYLARLSRHHRHELRRKRRKLAAARVRPGALDEYFALHRASPGEKGGFTTDRIEAFVRHLAATVGTLRVDVLEHDGRPLAVTLGFQGEATFFLYNMAFDQDERALSPGIVLVSRLVERAIEDGLTRLDFMRGLERYKLDFGAAPSRLTRVSVEARGVYGQPANPR